MDLSPQDNLRKPEFILSGTFLKEREKKGRPKAAIAVPWTSQSSGVVFVVRGRIGRLGRVAAVRGSDGLNRSHELVASFAQLFE